MSQLTKTKKYGVIKVEEFYKMSYEGCEILNLLPKNKAFEYFDKYAR